MQWYYSKNGLQLGPVSESDIRSKVATGEIAPTDLVWRDGMSDWLPSSRVPEIQPASTLASPAPLGGNPDSPYATPQAHPATPYQGQPHAGPEIANNLWQSIVVTLLCCLPFGVVSIVYAAKVNGLKQAGLYEEARQAAANSRKWTNISVICGLIGLVVQIILAVSQNR